MNKLVDLIETKYIALHFNNELTKILNEHAGEELDIADARFVPATARILENMSQQNGIKLHDTLRPERENILRQNEVNKLCREDSDNRVLLGLPKDILNPSEFLSSLDKSKIYYVEIDCDRQAYIPFITMAQMYLPRLQIDIAKISNELSLFITKELYSRNFEDMIKTSSSYYVFKGSEMWEVEIKEKDLDTEFYVFGIGMTTWNEIRTRHRLIPTYFGTRPLMKENSALKRVWKCVDDECLRQMLIYNEIKNNTLSGFVRGR